MTGTVKQSYLSEIHSKTKSDEQLGLNQFSDSSNSDEDNGTTIAVVRDPIGGITEVCDEFIKELGMPLKELNKFREKRSELAEEGDTKAHNRAAKEVQLEERYLQHIRNNTAAKEHIDELATRVANGETITLVCFESEDKWCHRHILKQEIEQQVSEKTTQE